MECGFGRTKSHSLTSILFVVYLYLTIRMSLVTCVGDLEASKTLLCGLQYSNSNSLQDMEGDLDKGQRGYVSHH
jgi:hypothetical protein